MEAQLKFNAEAPVLANSIWKLNTRKFNKKTEPEKSFFFHAIIVIINALQAALGDEHLNCNFLFKFRLIGTVCFQSYFGFVAHIRLESRLGKYNKKNNI